MSKSNENPQKECVNTEETLTKTNRRFFIKAAASAGGMLLASPLLAYAGKAKNSSSGTVGKNGLKINYGTRAHFGMLVPSVNTASEVQVTAMLPQGVSFYTTRLKLVGSDREEFLKMAAQAEEGAKLLADTKPGIIVFHCTAVSTMDPELEKSILSNITKATGIPSTSTAQALLHAFEVLQAKRIVLITPYIEAINKTEVNYFENSKITVLRQIGLGISSGAKMIEVTPQKWYDLALENAMPEADAYFISCTNIRSIEVIDAIEKKLKKPVVTSNQAMFWHTLRTLGIKDKIPGLGQLLSKF